MEEVHPDAEKTDRELLLSIAARLARMEELHEELMVKKPTQAEIAKKKGVHPSTLYRRRKRKQIDRLLEPLNTHHL